MRFHLFSAGHQMDFHFVVFRLKPVTSPNASKIIAALPQSGLVFVGSEGVGEAISVEAVAG